jgi:hypothetical protein
MGVISLTRTTDGTTSNANSNLNNNWTTLETAINGALDASNLAADAVGTAEILNAAVTLAKLASNSVDSSKIVDGSIVNGDIATAAAIVDSKLASPNNSVYKTIFAGAAAITGATVGPRFFRADGFVPVGDGLDTTIPIGLIYFDNTDFTVGSKTQKLRLRAQAHVNGTAPAITMTVGLVQVTAVSGPVANQIRYTMSSFITGSTVAFASPGANSQNQGNSGDFTIPADGYYALAANFTGSQAANSFVGLNAQLQTRNV